MKNLLRSLLPLLLLGLLAGCSVYENIVHPRRLPTPDMSKQAKAKFRAAEKARHKGQVLKSEEPVTGATDPSAAPGASEEKKDSKLSYSDLSEGTRNKYDKEGLIKNKPNLKRRQYHHYETQPLKHNEVNRESRKLRKSSAKGKGKRTDKSGDLDGSPRERTDQPVEAAPAEPVEKAPKEKKQKKDKKAPVPKPDPTLENSGN